MNLPKNSKQSPPSSSSKSWVNIWLIGINASLLVILLTLPVVASYSASTALQEPVKQSQDDKTPVPKTPRIEAASGEGEAAIKQFRYPEGLVCDLFAAEPDVANVVAIHRDFQGRMFVCETFRQENGVEDNRSHGHWMDEELAAQTVQDRIDYVKKYIPDAETSYTEQDDRIRMLFDSNGDGTADRSTVYSKGYNDLEMGTGAGVLSYRGNVYYTCIPKLFLLNDRDGDGVADVQLVLHDGYGVRYAFRGHDMHGLIVGPDGRLYFSIGDRGYNISAEVKDPASGAVFRCDLDGRNLEVVATGLRNPQELAFDNFGNLFTGDNNSDSGDKARFTEIVEGGDTGWRMHYQYISDRGPFNREKIWHPFNKETPAYIIPPIANIGDGPSGLEFYPGTGFGDRFKDRFLLCDFRGNATASGVRAFRAVQDGAAWKLADEDEKPFWNMLITDVDFGSDGRLYMSDWVFGWQGVNKGRIYSFHDPEHINSLVVKEVESVLKDGMKKFPTDNLTKFLGHADQRIRQEAQFELVLRKQLNALLDVATPIENSTLARVHAIWGVEQLYRGSIANHLKKTILDVAEQNWLGDADHQVVIAATKLVATAKPKSSSGVVALLKHENRRVRYQAAMALNKLGRPDDATAIAELLVENNDADPILRHGGIMAMVGVFEREPTPGGSAVAKLAEHESAAVRRAVVVAMRKVIESNRPNTFRAKQAAAKIVGSLLNDIDDSIVLEAGRVIHDLGVRSQMKKLASLVDGIDRFEASDALVRRILNANFRVGTQVAAKKLAQYAADPGSDVARRLDVIDWLRQWAIPPARDHVLHNWRPLNPKQRNVMDARNAVESVFDELLDGNDEIAAAAIAAAGDLKLTAIGEGLARLVQSTTVKESARVAGLQSLGRLNFKDLSEVLRTLGDESKVKLPPTLKTTLIDVAAKRLPPSFSLPKIGEVLERGSVEQKQAVIATLGKMNDGGSEAYLRGFVGEMIAGTFDEQLRLDVVLACENRKSSVISGLLKEYRDGRVVQGSITTNYLDSLQGGNVEAGREIFIGKTEVSCVRCHQVGSQGGAVGPDLSGVGLTRDRYYLLEAITEPNKKIAEGFAQTKVLTTDGRLIVGLVTQSNEKGLELLDADGKEILIAADDIEETMVGQSSMPIDLHEKLTRNELRDLVAYLAAQKKPQDNDVKDLEHE